mmetsp:Transcript_13366/g.28388  ORF Transcript_13366/g.28388 Transcript_13366/m.28388 type:complete len:230 (+) Transcript_13366:283-972(+)
MGRTTREGTRTGAGSAARRSRETRGGGRKEHCRVSGAHSGTRQQGEAPAGAADAVGAAARAGEGANGGEVRGAARDPPGADRQAARGQPGGEREAPHAAGGGGRALLLPRRRQGGARRHPGAVPPRRGQAPEAGAEADGDHEVLGGDAHHHQVARAPAHGARGHAEREGGGHGGGARAHGGAGAGAGGVPRGAEGGERGGDGQVGARARERRAEAALAAGGGADANGQA